MTILFAGGEDSDFTKIGACTVDTATTTVRRTAYTRCSLRVSPGASGDGWQAQFAASSTFWVSARARLVATSSTPGGSRVVTLYGSGITPRLALAPSYAGTNGPFTNIPWQLVKYDSTGAGTVLATSTGYYVNNDASMFKLDVFVNYAAAGQVQVYVDGTKIIDYSGDVTTNSNTTLSAVTFGMPTINSNAWWSEIIVATTDTRSLTLATLAPAAAGNTYAWTGAVTTINEITADDTTMATSSTAGQVLETTVTSTVVPATAGVVSLVVSARAQKGNTGGPANINLMVRTGGADYTGPSQALPTSFAALSNAFDTNPATGLPWTPADLTAGTFNIGVKSLT